MKKGLRESGRSTPGLPALTDRLNSLVRDELSGSAMSDERENSVATVLAAIERVRSERSEVTLKYDSALAKLIAAGRDLGAEMPHEDRAPEAANPEPGAELTTDDRAAGAAQPEPGAEVWVDGPVPGSVKQEPGAEVSLDGPVPGSVKPEPGAEVSLDGPVPEGKADQTNNNYFAGFNAYWWCHFRDHLHPMGWYRDCRDLSEQECIKVSFSEDALD